MGVRWIEAPTDKHRHLNGIHRGFPDDFWLQKHIDILKCIQENLFWNSLYKVCEPKVPIHTKKVPEPAKFPTIKGKLYPCLTAADIKAKGMCYGEKCTKWPAGWSESELHKVQLKGYSRAGIHNLNPAPSLYNAAGLLQIKDKMTPYLLDPSLEEFQSMYAFGNGEAMGYYPNNDLIAKRKKALEEQSATQKFKGKGGTKRPHRDSSISLTASNSNERKSQQIRQLRTFCDGYRY